MTIDRRSLLKGGAAIGLAGATNLAEFAKAWAQTNQWKPETGAKLACCAGSISCRPRTTPSSRS